MNSNEDWFWQIIAATAENCEDVKDHFDKLSVWLKSAQDHELARFTDLLVGTFLQQAWTFDIAFVMQHLYVDGGFFASQFSASVLTTGIEWLILKGREQYQESLTKPDLLAYVLNVRNFDGLFDQFPLVASCLKELALRKLELPKPLAEQIPVYTNTANVPNIAKMPALKNVPPNEKTKKEYLSSLGIRFPQMSAQSRTMGQGVWHPTDRALLQQNLDMGDNLSKEREVDHFFICKSRKAADLLKKALIECGHSLGPDDEDVSDPKTIYLHSTEVTSPIALTSRKESLLALVKKCGAAYDGWGSTITP